jgi:DNA polymerase I-like protein with 3'-5' exonuclease and polymerase domains
MYALDTETTGLDLRHGCKPYFVTLCDAAGDQRWWEWWVDPLTRQPAVPPEDLQEVKQVLAECDGFVLQNTKFDATALMTIGITPFPWAKVYDTLLAGHLLASNQPHDLTSMALHYLGVDAQPYEDKLRDACQAARRYCRSHYPTWKIAKAGLLTMPSAGKEDWKADGWLPRQLAQELGYHDDHHWHTVLRDYANSDSAVTVALWGVMEQELKSKDLWGIYLERLKLLRISYLIEERGLTVSGTRLEELKAQYQQESAAAEGLCLNVARSMGADITLPRGGNNKALTDFVFNTLNLPVVRRANKGKGGPSLDKYALEEYEATLPDHSRARVFVSNLKAKRSRDTAITFLDAYKRFWLAVGQPGWWRLHPSLNMTGTDTLRWSSQSPNEQNISKKSGFNLRYCFGPAPGREWWSLDAQNIELRIPAYEAGEQAMIDLFERPDDPPYFGSNHLLACHILHPALFEACTNPSLPPPHIDGRIFKDKYKSTWYSWTKNGNFAVQYGAQESSGTADRAYHVPGGQAKIQQRLGKINDLNQAQILHAEKYGYVETIPDKTVNPHRGYPLLCTRTEWGKILPTVPLSYHVQGTACWWMAKAMVRCQQQLDQWNNKRTPSQCYYLIAQIHDELLFDFPYRPDRGNLAKILTIKRLMEQGGDDIGIPTPVSCELHLESWATGESVA